MAGTAANPSRPGLVQGGTDDRAIYLKLFLGEVLTAYNVAVRMASRHRTQRLNHGKSGQFPAIFTTEAEYHTPGDQILGNVIPSQEVTIDVDDILLAHVFLADIDEMLSQYQFRAPYAEQLGQALARAYDANVARCVLQAARGGALFTGDQGGSTLTNASYATDGNVLLDGFGDARQAMDEKNVPVDTVTVHGVVKPAQFYLIAATDRNIRSNYGGDGKAFREGGYVLKPTYDVEIVKSNNIPFGKNETDTATYPKLLSKYREDWTNTIGLCWTDMAAGTVLVRGTQLQNQPMVDRQGELLVARQLSGHGPLRTKCAVELTTA